MQKRISGSLRRMALVTLGWCLASMVLATTALGAPGHALAGNVSTPVSGGLAVNTTSGATYVADSTGISEVSTGTPEPFVAGTFGGLAVDSDSGTVYAIDTTAGTVNRYAADKTDLGPLDGSEVPGGTLTPAAVAVDPSTGWVFVANVAVSPAVVHVFDETGAYQAELTGGDAPFSFPTGMAIDGSDNLYVVDGGSVNKYGTDGTFQTLFATDASAVAADAANDEVYVAQSNPTSGVLEVVHYDAAGAVLFRFGEGEIFGASGMGVNATSRVFVADPSLGAVPFFDPVIAPDVTTGAATPGATTASLTGTVDPLGQPTSYQYEWGTSTDYGNVTDPVDTSGGSGPEAAPASLSGLLPAQEYHFRLTATSETALGPVRNVGDDATFTTDALPPGVATGDAEEVRWNSARVHGLVNPNNKQTTYTFEYGPTTAYGSQVEGELPPGDADDHPVSARLTGLEGGVTYHYRLIADNGEGGVQVGEDRTFTTLDPLATAAVGPPTDVTKSSATVHGTVDNHGFPASYFFTVKGTDSPYVGASPTIQLAPKSGPQAVSASFGDLPIGSGFEVRIVTRTEGGTFVSQPLGFRTQESVFVPPPPVIFDPNPYGCVAPHLNAFKGKARAGRAITLTGSDLGVGGVVTFGSSMAEADSWSATAIRIVVPDNARGSAAVKVDCSRESNTIKVGIAKAKGKSKAKRKSCKRGFVKKKVRGKTRCVKRKSGTRKRRR